MMGVLFSSTPNELLAGSPKKVVIFSHFLFFNLFRFNLYLFANITGKNNLELHIFTEGFQHTTSRT